MGKQQINNQSLVDIEKFICNMKEITNKFYIQADHLVNADETLLHASKSFCNVERIEVVYKSGGSEVPPSMTVGSLTPFVSSSGVFWLLVFCFKIPRSNEKEGKLEIYIPLQGREKQSENSPFSILLLGSTSGLLNSSLWDISIQYFIKIIREISNFPQKEIVLLTDNLGIHCQPSSVANALKKGCYQIYFPPNSSHFIQPLDNLLFANLKQSVYHLCGLCHSQSMFWTGVAPSAQELVVDAVMECLPSVFSVRNILKSWENVGVSPLDEIKLRRHMKTNIRNMKKKKDLQKSYKLAMEVKDTISLMREEYLVSSENRKQKAKHVSISTNWATSGSTGIEILESIEKKRKLDEEIVNQKRQEREEKERVKREKGELKKKEREERELAKNEQKKICNKKKKEEAKEREKKRNETLQEKAEKREAKENRRLEKEKEKILRFASHCKAQHCKKVWSSGVKDAEFWVWCSTCDHFGICSKHAEQKEYTWEMRLHEKNCAK